ncbi:hypothetical protein DIPPA_14889 [Diplonema papillatum]|nr:hypothetical protein DIPPA_14889 [Diplonema papillatum]
MAHAASVNVRFLLQDVKESLKTEHGTSVVKVQSYLKSRGIDSIDDLRDNVETLRKVDKSGELRRWLSEVPRVSEVKAWTEAPFNAQYLSYNMHGNIPLIISAPHGGIKELPGVRKRKESRFGEGFSNVGDVNTADVVASTCEVLREYGLKPFFVTSRVHRRFVDLNRPPMQAFEPQAQLAKELYFAYHSILTGAISRAGSGGVTPLLIDVHGQGRTPNLVYRGTRNFQTMQPHDCARGHPILETLASNEVLLHPSKRTEKELQCFDGGWTVTVHGREVSACDAIQLELGRSYRDSDESTAAMGRKLADSVAAYFSTGAGSPTARSNL